MERNTYVEAALFEHRFWLQILGDHCRFIKGSLSVTEEEELQRVLMLQHVFDTYLERARRHLSPAEVQALSRDALQAAQELRTFKLHLLTRHLSGKIMLHLSPTFLNHMVNELEEYLRLLDSLVQGELPPRFHAVHHHLLWLPDASGHAGAVHDMTDAVEKDVRKKAQEFTKLFDELYFKSIEVANYMRTHLRDFPALARLNAQSALEIAVFQNFLREVEEMRVTDELLGTLTVLMADHMAREECYYLTKLAQVSAVDDPECDPTRPRHE
ncbi:MAG TPA: DUF2935 domain-containing protein [Bacilli bacterium]|nr:DUF2935 domain-containing protein [Bacilli bacterium]